MIQDFWERWWSQDEAAKGGRGGLDPWKKAGGDILLIFSFCSRSPSSPSSSSASQRNRA